MHILLVMCFGKTPSERLGRPKVEGFAKAGASDFGGIPEDSKICMDLDGKWKSKIFTEFQGDSQRIPRRIWMCFSFLVLLCSRKSVKKNLDMARASQLNSLDVWARIGLAIGVLHSFSAVRMDAWSRSIHLDGWVSIFGGYPLIHYRHSGNPMIMPQYLRLVRALRTAEALHFARDFICHVGLSKHIETLVRWWTRSLLFPSFCMAPFIRICKWFFHCFLTTTCQCGWTCSGWWFQTDSFADYSGVTPKVVQKWWFQTFFLSIISGIIR